MNKQNVDYEWFEKERMIRFSDLIEELLRKIWLIVVCAIVIAIAFGGYKYAQDKAAVRAANAISQDDPEASLTEEELQQVKNVIAQQQRVEDQQKYVEHSIRMQINAYSEDSVNIQFMVKGDASVTKNALKSLEQYVSNGSLANDLQEIYPDLEKSYISELITFENDSEELQASDLQTLRIESAENVFYVSVIHLDADSAQRLADDVVTCINSYQDRSEQAIGSYELAMIDMSVGQVVDTELQSYQTNIYNDLKTMQSNLSDSKENLSEIQTSVLNTTNAGDDIESEEEMTADLPTSSEAIHVSVSKKYVGIGALGGIVLGIIIIILRYVLSGTIHISDEFSYLFGVSVLGQVDLHSRKNILVILWRKLLNRRKELPVQEEKARVYSNIMAYCRQNELQKILIAGSAEELDRNAYLQELCTELQSEGLKTQIVANFPYTAAALDKLSDSEAVILVETLHSSRYADVLGGVLKCLELEHRICGVIALN